jgi:hypothetical protein
MRQIVIASFIIAACSRGGLAAEQQESPVAVSYTHLTLPTSP